MQVRDGPAAVRGDALRPHCHWLSSWEGGEGGAPSQKTCRPPRNHRTPRGREDSCRSSFSSSSSAFSCSQAPPRRRPCPIGSSRCRRRRPRSLFAIGAGKQVVAVDDQSDYPKDAPQTKLSGFTPNVEAIAGYKPDLVVARLRPGRPRRRAARARHPRARSRTRPKDLADMYAQISRSARSPATRERPTSWSRR